MRRRRRSTQCRLLASVVLAATFALTSAPVCGSLSALDSDSCCQRLACGQAAAPSRSTTRVDQSCGDCCPLKRKASATDNSAANCCKLGRLAYPTIKPQSSACVARALPLVSMIPISSFEQPARFVHEFHGKTPPSIPVIPLYALTATYRI